MMKKYKKTSCFGIVSTRVHDVILILGLCSASKRGREKKRDSEHSVSLKANM